MPFGAEIRPQGGVAFRLWAPDARKVDLCLERGGAAELSPMCADQHGWFRVVHEDAGPGAMYRFRIDGEHLVSDPASRFQPQDVHGPSCVVDPERFEWRDTHWLGRPWEETVLYELHVGAFTERGTYASAATRLGYLAELGITAVELMPVADFPGRRNWGYDGVLPFAPDSCYGGPDELKAFVAAAHQLGIMVIMDVVYNHFGPDGNDLQRYARDFFTDRYATPWGDAINYDGPNSTTVREFFIHNALYWLEEFNVDGLRLDAVHAIFDESEPDILVELAQTVRSRVPPDRHVHLLLENEDNTARYLHRDADGRPSSYTAQWNDDWHHAAHVLLTGETHGYYRDYADRPCGHLLRCLTEGFCYQGEPSRHREGGRRGTPSAALPGSAFIAFLQNHDQVGNRALGERLTRLTSLEGLRAAAAIQVLSPAIPALFMGEEFGCEQPFLFFTDFGGELATAVAEGRRREFGAFDVARRTGLSGPPDPNDRQTFRRSVIDWEKADQPRHQQWLAFYRSLLELRHRMIVPRLAGTRAEPGAMLIGECGLAVCWRMGDGSRLLLVANPGAAPLQLDRRLSTHDSAALYCQPGSPEAFDRGDVLPPWFVGWYLGTASI